MDSPARSLEEVVDARSAKAEEGWADTHNDTPDHTRTNLSAVAEAAPHHTSETPSSSVHARRVGKSSPCGPSPYPHLRSLDAARNSMRGGGQRRRWTRLREVVRSGRACTALGRVCRSGRILGVEVVGGLKGGTRVRRTHGRRRRGRMPIRARAHVLALLQVQRARSYTALGRTNHAPCPISCLHHWCLLGVYVSRRRPPRRSCDASDWREGGAVRILDQWVSDMWRGRRVRRGGLGRLLLGRLLCIASALATYMTDGG